MRNLLLNLLRNLRRNLLRNLPHNLLFTGGNFRLSNHNVPPGSSENPYGEARSAEFDGTDGTGGRVGRSRKVSFKFLHTLWVYRLCICLLVYEIKIVTNILMGFKISCQVGGRGPKFQNYSRYVIFLFLGIKVHFWYPQYPSIMFIP